MMPHESIGKTHLSPMASCISFAATVLSTPPLTAPITRPASPQISRIRAISFPTNSSYEERRRASLCELTAYPPKNTGPAYRNNRYRCSTHHGPVALAATDAVYEPSDDLLSARGMRHLGMKLNTVDRFRVMRNGSIGRRFGMADNMKIWRRRSELIAVRHPHLHNQLLTAAAAAGDCANTPRTSISSPSPSNRASTDKRLGSLPNFLICTRAKPYSRCSHFATVPPRFHASS